MGQIRFDAQHVLGKTPGAFVIAEGGVNHNGDMALGFELIDAAAEAGADAIKFQTFKASRLVAPSAPKAEYQTSSGPEGESQKEMLKKLELSMDQHRQLQAHAAKRDLMFLSSPFDEQSVDLLVALGVEAIKLGSGEVTNVPLLQHAARTGLPVILSTGMSYLSEVDEAIRIVHDAGCAHLALMHCVSLYPTPPEFVNLKAMTTLQHAYAHLSIGFSDHTMGLAVSVAAVARGATMIEKHLTLDRQMEGPDHAASLEPEQFKLMVSMIREVEASLGDGIKAPVAGESEMRAVARRSLHIREAIGAGDVLTEAHLAVWRPSHGLASRHLDDVLGRRVVRDMTPGEALQWKDLHG